MKRKVLHWIFGLSIATGLLLLYGTAGSIELDRVDLDTSLMMILTGVLVTVFGLVGLKLSGFRFED